MGFTNNLRYNCLTPEIRKNLNVFSINSQSVCAPTTQIYWLRVFGTEFFFVSMLYEVLHHIKDDSYSFSFVFPFKTNINLNIRQKFTLNSELC